ncbi:MAG: DUF1840 domain-containing protein [Comamonas sp.]|uniref:DUF1840 domain-containing protein n=1 Tax=Acidovorax sp. CCYZU-2555 TaxID=2835042 RepID=UPI001BCC479B|nr:DUF1840 domain-containing protein [Acidovorax sp. CCYZU-2555]MBS7778859.1 DUF1840 domain-containing protein [Acidovorax sp. CCYZU-2555]
MPYKFKSRATADLIMLDASARKLLAIVGKDADGPGIITAMQIPGALAALEQAVLAEEAQRAASGETQDADDGAQDDENDAPAGAADGVSLRQRTAPFIDMLKRSGAEGRDVTW